MTQMHTDAMHMGASAVSPQAEKDARMALYEAGLGGWNVTKVPMYADLREHPSHVTDVMQGKPTPNGYQMPSTYATVADIPGQGLRPLGVVGENYKVVQNEEHAEFLDNVVDLSGGHYEVARSFRGGRLVFISIKLPDHVSVGGQDPIELYLNGINSFDGSTHFMLNLDPVRAHCSNQLSMFRRNSFKIRHSGDMKGKVQLAREALNLAFRHTGEMQETAERMVATDMAESTFWGIVQDMWPGPKREDYPMGGGDTVGFSRALNRHHRIMEGVGRSLKSPSNANISETAWGGMNAVVEYLDHEHGSDKNRAERIMLSSNMTKLKTEAMTRFGELVGV